MNVTCLCRVTVTWAWSFVCEALDRVASAWLFGVLHGFPWGVAQCDLKFWAQMILPLPLLKC